MSPRTRDTSLCTVLYFKPKDYVGFGKRLVILVVDLFVVAVSGVSSLFIGGFASVFFGDVVPLFVLACLVWIWLYMTAIKASPLRTLGYRAVGAKIVTLRAQRPSIFRMTFRFGLWRLEPFNLVYDLFWTTVDDERQTLRDRFAGTYVVDVNAEPLGEGEIHIARSTVLGYNFAYEYVSHIAPAPQAQQASS